MKLNTNKPVYVYARDLDEESMKQFESCYSCDYVKRAALMPDAHRGYVAPIGAVLITKDYVVPAWVGYDIGCGVTAVKLSSQIKDEKIIEKIKSNKNEIYEEVKNTVPMGMGKINSIGNLHRETREEFDVLFNKLKEKDHDPEVLDWIKRKAPACLGSLGEGNHFIELSVDENNEAWIVIHSGSRNVGHKVAQKYMIKSSGDTKNFEETHPLKITSKFGKEYVAVLDFGLDFALLNRMEMVKTVVDCIETVLEQPINFEVWTNKNHNHAVKEVDFENEEVFIHRKGATPAKLNERGVIPGNMRDGCYLVIGKGNVEFLESSSHGAGRKLSRKAAKENISLKQFKESMKGIVGTIKEGTLDEAPDAYKDFEEVMSLQKDSISVVSHLKPVINWKGDAKKNRFKKKSHCENI